MSDASPLFAHYVGKFSSETDVLQFERMGFFIEVRCIETGETFEFSDYSTITYHRCGYEPVRVPQGPAWCYDCHRIRMAEVFPQYIALRERDLDAARRDPDSEIAFILGGDEKIDVHARELTQLKACLQNRTSGPRCLTCFSEHIQIMPDRGAVLLPDGKHYAVGNCGFADFVLDIEFEIDINGNKICRTKR